MNLKERGITVGDLLIILIIITSTVLIKSFSKDKKTTYNYSNQEQVIYKKQLLSKINLNSLYKSLKKLLINSLTIKYLLCKFQELIILKQ